MATEYVIAIIGVVGSIAGTVIGLLSSIYYESIKEKRKLKSELQSAINKVLFETLLNNYQPVLYELRCVIIKNSKSINNKAIMKFYHKWLVNIDHGEPGSFFFDEHIEPMKSELSSISL